MRPVARRGTLLLLTTGLSVGGAEVQLMELALRVRELGWRVEVVSLLAPGALCLELKAAGIIVHSLDMHRGVPNPFALLRFARIVRRTRPDVVHAHMVHANILARLGRLLAHIPRLICTAHNIQEGGRLREILYRVTDSLASVTTSICAAGVKRYIEVGAAPAGRIHHVPNGVDLARFKPDGDMRLLMRASLGIPDDEFVWLHVGRMEPVKNHSMLLDAIGRIPSDQSMRLLLAGDGPLAGDIRAQAAATDGRVMLLGLRRDVPALLAAADGFVLSSRWEGLPIVLLEAAAAGVPCVVPDVGGCAEAVANRRSGYVVEPHCISALTKGMQSLMRLERTEREAMALAARAHAAAHFDVEHIVHRWDRIYRGESPVIYGQQAA